MNFDQDAAFDEAFSPGALALICNEQLQSSSIAGIDRVSAAQFRLRADAELDVIRRKCLDGSYKFTAFHQKLTQRGEGKPPRVLSIPTVRDRIVLSATNRLLQVIFDDFVNRHLPNRIVERIASTLGGAPSTTRYCRMDVENYYPSIDHSLLLQRLGQRVRCDRLLRLVRRALCTSTVAARSSATRMRPVKGVPQGLAISNVLAEIYLDSLDAKLRDQAFGYERYMDDALVLGSPEAEPNLISTIRTSLKELKLELNREKSRGLDGGFLNLTEPFSFLGYQFNGSTVGVREANFQRFVDSLAGLVSAYRSARVEGPYNVSVAGRRRAFVADLNERVTGAISAKRRYGWVFFYLSITDLRVLFRLDQVLRSLCNRIPRENAVAAGELKSFARAFHEAKYSPMSGYIQNYNTVDSTQQRIAYLADRGWLQPTEERTYSEAEIDKMFDQVRTRHLTRLDRDIGVIS